MNLIEKMSSKNIRRLLKNKIGRLIVENNSVVEKISL